MDDDDAELAAIRARIRQELMTQAAAPDAAPTTEAASLDRPIEVDDASFEAFVRGHDNAVVDCWAPWCGPCRIVGPIVDQLAQEMSGRVVFGKLNVDVSPRVAQTFAVQSIPTLLVFRQQRLVDRIVGAAPKPQLAMTLERIFGRRSSGSPAPRRM